MSNFNIDQALVALGADAEQVAATLKEKGYQGYRHRAHACPIYHYLTDLNFDVSVNPSIISCYGHLGNEEDIATERVIPPLAVRRFIFRFDEGGFPELEKK